MANVLRHRFVSAKTDGPDATQVQPSSWNDGHVFTGGAAGDVLTRDPTDPNYGAIWKPQGVWIAYVPTWTSSGSQPAIGDGSIEGVYTLIGKTCHFQIKITIQAGTVQGSGVWVFGLPVPAVPTGLMGSGLVVDPGYNIYFCNTMYNDANRVFLYTPTFPFQVQPGVPIAFGPGDEIYCEGTYAAA